MADGLKFTGNSTPRHGGGMRVATQAGNDGLHFSVKNCVFEKNKASFGGGLYCLAVGKSGSFEMAGSKFMGNSVEEMNLPGWGQADGGLGVTIVAGANNCSVSIDDCQFDGNSSSYNEGGAGVYNEASATVCRISNSTFHQNKTHYNGSGFLLWNEGKNIDFEMNACHFTENMADSASSAAGFVGTAGGTGEVVIDSCSFENNLSFESGGVEMGNWENPSGQMNYQLTNSLFKNNQSNQGGGLTIFDDTKSKANFMVDNCVIEGNISSGKAGGILVIPANTGFRATISRCKIIGNQSADSGGAMHSRPYFSNIPFPSNASLIFENCLIADNTSTGATLSADSLPNFKLLNCTIAENQSDGIRISGSSGLVLQNTILHNPGFTEFTASANSSFTSKGGNLIGDGSLAGQLAPTDKQSLDPLFSGDFHLITGSPCIDMGVDLGNLPALDLDGNLRVFGPLVDIGAFEFGSSSSIREVIAGELSVSPNPATDFLKIEKQENLSAEPQAVQIFDATGKLVLEKNLVSAGQMLDLTGLPPGVFALKVVAGERVFLAKFIKQ